MNALAQQVPMTPHWRLRAWAARAWHRMGWRHVLLALLIELARNSVHPLGGIFFPPVELPGWDPVVPFLNGGWVGSGIPTVFCVLVADEAFDDGVAPLRAYGLALVAMVAIVPLASRLYQEFTGLLGANSYALGRGEGVAQFVWWSLVMLYEVGFGLAIYAYWRVTQRTMRQAQAAETERVLNEQRVQTAQLLALQSRVDPQLLFDALVRVGALHRNEPQAADALLSDLIALLRSLHPRAVADHSTAQREFALVEAWLRVTRSAGRDGVRVRTQMAPDARPAGLAPMLVLPLLRSVLALPHATEGEWLLGARVAGPRLVVTLQSNAGGDNDLEGVLAHAELSSLHDRIGRLFGQAATLTLSLRPRCITLDLPLLHEEYPDDDRTDR
jgi:hypothetical protein